jgi:hypothetical protein
VRDSIEQSGHATVVDCARRMVSNSRRSAFAAGFGDAFSAERFA